MNIDVYKLNFRDVGKPDKCEEIGGSQICLTSFKQPGHAQKFGLEGVCVPLEVYPNALL